MNKFVFLSRRLGNTFFGRSYGSTILFQDLLTFNLPDFIRSKENNHELNSTFEYGSYEDSTVFVIDYGDYEDGTGYLIKKCSK